MTGSPKQFIWYELMTTDTDGAEAFYRDVVGWRPQSFPGQTAYTVMNAGDRGVAGVMMLPDNVRQAGGRPAWIGYIHADDTDAATQSVRQAGGAVHREPADIPGVGRFSVVADPQGAVFILLTPTGEDRPPAPPMTPGHVGWHELMAADWEKAFAFYSGQFGWTKAEAMDMGPMGTYQLFAAGGEAIGGMMTKPAEMPAPFWLFYFIVPELDAAMARITSAGGKNLIEPMEVPGGAWIVHATDPQGALFALVAAKR